MPQSLACAKCGSRELLAGEVKPSEGEVNLYVYGKPEALIFKDSERCPINAVTCGSCGFVELYATRPEDLLAAWRRSQQHSKT